MSVADTIVAVASPPGRSARAIVRLSGAATQEVLASVLAMDRGRPFDRGCFRSRLRLGDRLELPVLVSVFRGRASYTGQDSAEILLPGNPALVERVLSRLTEREGVRPAGPGEFSARAYLNDKLTLEQAEGVAAVIAAESREQLAAANELLAGRTPYRRWADELTTLLALVEAGIDFTDQEDVVPIAPAELARRIRVLRSEIDVHLGGEGAAESAGHMARVVLAGEPNTGKSTLFNALLGRERAVVSPLAGTTRDVLEEELDLSRDLPGAGPVLLADLAGLDASVGSAAGCEAQAAAREAIARADVVVQCDPAGRFEALAGARKPVIRVRTKADLLRRGKEEARPDAALPGKESAPSPIAVCALDGWNVRVLRRAIADAACGSRGTGLSAVLPRHRRALAATGAGLSGALRACAADRDRLAEPELVAGSLREALDALGELVGRISPDDVIGRVFATFCVGK